MELNTLLQYKPYSTARTEKRALYAGLLTGLTQFHRERCPEYGRLLDALGCPAHMECTVESAPMLPVSLFKELELRSIPEGEVFKTITSSGTTGQRVSRIFLDGATSACQQQALCQIMSDFLGERRLPFLVLDSRQVLRNRAMFSARGAGILGFSIFGTRPCYALDEHMEPCLLNMGYSSLGGPGSRIAVLPSFSSIRPGAMPLALSSTSAPWGTVAIFQLLSGMCL